MKLTPLLFVAALAAPLSAVAAEPVSIDIYATGVLKHSVALSSAHPTVTVTHPTVPNTTLELSLIAPEPLILDVKEETLADGKMVEAEGRVKLLAPGNSFSVSDIQGANFHSPYVLTRPQ